LTYLIPIYDHILRTSPEKHQVRALHGTRKAGRTRPILNDPPHILLTNYVMLEYMLLRPAERHLAERLAEMREKLANYKRFRELTDEWVELVVELEQQERERNR
jgi:hypothetical protein